MMAPFAGGASRRREPSGTQVNDTESARRPSADRRVGRTIRAMRRKPLHPTESPEVRRARSPGKPVPAGEHAQGRVRHRRRTSKTARVTVIDFPVGRRPDDRRPAAERESLAAEVGLGPIDKEALDERHESIEIDGKPATYARDRSPTLRKPEQSQIERRRWPRWSQRRDDLVLQADRRPRAGGRARRQLQDLPEVGPVPADGGANDGN